MTLPKNSVGAKQLKRNAVRTSKIKKGAVTSSKVKDRSLLAKDFKAGQLPAGAAGPIGPRGEGGPAGVPAAKAFAFVRVTGAAPAPIELVYGSGVRSAARVPVESVPGRYDVVFDRNVAGCVAQVQPGTGMPRGAATPDTSQVDSKVTVDPDDLPGIEDDVVRVLFLNPASINNTIDSSFMITLFC